MAPTANHYNSPSSFCMVSCCAPGLHFLPVICLEQMTYFYFFFPCHQCGVDDRTTICCFNMHATQLALAFPGTTLDSVEVDRGQTWLRVATPRLQRHAFMSLCLVYSVSPDHVFSSKGIWMANLLLLCCVFRCHRAR